MTWILVSGHVIHIPRVQFQLWDSDDVPVPREELLQKVKGVDALLCVLTEKIDAELLDAAGWNCLSVTGFNATNSLSSELTCGLPLQVPT